MYRRIITMLVVAAGVLANVSSASAIPGDLTFAGCIGDLPGCTTTTPPKALDGAYDVAVSGQNAYVTSGSVVSHFTLDAAGNLTFAGCIGDLPGCTTTTP